MVNFFNNYSFTWTCFEYLHAKSLGYPRRVVTEIFVLKVQSNMAAMSYLAKLLLECGSNK